MRKLEEQGITEFIYQKVKSICQGKEPKIPNATGKITQQAYQAAIQEYKSKKTLKDFITLILLQKQLIFKP